MTYTLDRLVEKKMIKRVTCPHDRRAVICKLDSGGWNVLERINHIVRKQVLPAADTWSLSRLEAVVEALESIHPGRE